MKRGGHDCYSSFSRIFLGFDGCVSHAEGKQEGKDLALLIVPLENCLTFTENVCM